MQDRFPVVLHYAAPAKYAKGGLVDAALAVKNAGRYGDTELIHVNKAELAELKHMWGEPTINPQTGQPEFFLGFLKKLLPIAAMFIPGIGPAIGGALGIGAAGGSALLGAGMGALNGGVKGAITGGLTGGIGASAASPLVKTAVDTGAGAVNGGVSGALGALGGDVVNGVTPAASAPATGAPIVATPTPVSTRPNFWNRDFLGIKGIKNKYAIPALGVAATLLGGNGGNQGDPPPDQAAQDKFFNPVFKSTGHQPTSGFSDLGARGQGDGSVSNSRAFQAYNAGYMPERANFNYVQGGYAKGGSVSDHDGDEVSPFAVRGKGDGRSDSIPAALSDGEYVMDAETVNMLGDGSTKAGAQKLDALRVNLRKHKGRNLAKGKISLSAKSPEAYMAGGRA